MTLQDQIDIRLPEAVAQVPVNVDPVPVLEITTPRFCGRCGSRWESAWSACETCEQKKRIQTVALDTTTESRALKSVIWLYLSLLAVCMIGIAFGTNGNDLTIQFIELIGISAIVLIWSMFSFRTVLPALGTGSGFGWFALAIGLSLVSVAIATGVIRSFNAWLHMPNLMMSRPFLHAGFGWGMVILCCCVQPALFEELAFRGVIFGGLLKVLSRFETIMVSALMFMILHLAPARFPHTLALGVAAGYLRLKTKSLYPCMVLHFSHNFICVLLEWLGR